MSEKYRWLKDVTRSLPSVLNEIKVENGACDRWFEPHKIKKDSLYREMVDRVDIDFESVHVRDGGYDYFSKRGSDEGQYSHWRKNRVTGEIELLLDENALSRDGFCSVGDIVVSDDGELMAYSIDSKGDEEFTLIVKRISDGYVLDRVEGVSGDDICFVEGDRGILYLRRDDSFRTYQVWGKLLGGDEFLIVEEDIDGFYLSCKVSRDKRFVVVESSSVVTSGVKLLERGNVKVVHNLVDKVEGSLVSVDSFGGVFYALTDYQRKDGRLVTFSNGLERGSWVDVITFDEGMVLQDYELFNTFTALEVRVNGFSRVGLLANDGEICWISDLTGSVSDVIGDNPVSESHQLRFVRDSWLKPSEYWLCTVNSSGATIDSCVELVDELKGFDPEAYSSELFFFEGSGGVQVPISVIWRKGIVFSDAYVTAYSSYGDCFEPGVVNSWISLLDRGIVIGVVHGRGGGEFGRDWHDGGRLEYRENSIDDFIKGVEFLIDNGYAKSGRVVISGGSAGGTLVGAAVNRRAELFKGVVAEVPFVDCLSSMLDSTLPLTKGEYEQWGDPSVERYYDAIKRYSPIDNISAVEYPDIYCVVGLHDVRVGYWEGMIWVKDIRDFSTRDGSYLLRVLSEGHSGASGRWGRLEEDSEWLVFVLECLR